LTDEKTTYLDLENDYFGVNLRELGVLELVLWKLLFGIHPVDFPTGPFKNKISHFVSN
jgi:hypothetical protein